jgi:7-carboxy-7-deazaguanine synthase
MKKLAVSEKFYSIQGEGQTMGIPSIFLRLGGCNLLCESKDWICDTIEVWRKSNATPYDKIFTPEEVKRLSEGVHLVITGGEPLMHQKHIIDFLYWFIDVFDFTPVIEIETNGTIIPSYELDMLVAYWNVSPKLTNAGEQNKREVRINEIALSAFSNYSKKTIFKFVISKEEDILEMLQDFSNHIDMERVYLMPAGSSQEQLNATRPLVVEKCKELGVNYSERLHIVIWNLKTGV